MIQSTKRTDIDLTATWHGDMSDTLMQPMIDGFDDKAVVGEINFPYSHRSFHNSYSKILNVASSLSAFTHFMSSLMSYDV